MRNYLAQQGYVLDSHHKVWRRPDYEGIAYSDGDEVEARLREIIDQAVDLSVLSPELNRHQLDWPLLYHLSGQRANLLRPLAERLRGQVLEVGAGCGALTRFLGENGAQVLALEGSIRRAALARARTRDLAQVTVVAERFDQWGCERQFDVVTLVGVLEYAGQFNREPDPALAMLRRARSLLKPGGLLILAIENQLGLKYLAGAAEDHLGQPMVGIEGRYQPGQPRTFGRAALAGLLEQAGFASQSFLIPLPDYKLPVAVISPAGLSHPGFDAASLAWQTARRDPQLPLCCHFSLEMAWPQVFANHLGLELANSFLVVASPQGQADPGPEALAWYYSINRRPEYCKQTRFQADPDGGISVAYQSLAPPRAHQAESGQQILEPCHGSVAEYVTGEPLSWQFVRMMSNDGWSMRTVGDYLGRYLAILQSLAARRGVSLSLTRLDAPLPGELFDALPQNIILPPGGEPQLIDQEWRLAKGYGFDLAHLLLRSLMLLMDQVGGFGQGSEEPPQTHGEFARAAFGALGFELSDRHLARLLEREMKVLEQVLVNAQSLRVFYTAWPQQPLPRRVLNHGQELARRDQTIAELGQALSLRESQLALMQGTLSWRITRLPRALKHLWRHRRGG